VSCTRARTRTEIIVSSAIREADLRLRLDEKIAGWPAKEVRALLRHFSRDLWTVKEAANQLEAPEERTRRLVYTLRKLGYVEVASGQPAGTWRHTMAGNALAHATAALPISRAHADRQLMEFLARVETVMAMNPGRTASGRWCSSVVV
jgi:hypothetical protein